MKASAQQIAELTQQALDRGGSYKDAPGLVEACNGGEVKPKGRVRHEPGKMNGTEKAYAAHLNDRISAGEVHRWYFEGLKLRLADKTYLTVDFLVILADGEVQFHEVKGFMEDDAAVKIKVAASQFNAFPFYVVKKEKGLWSIRKVSDA